MSRVARLLSLLVVIFLLGACGGGMSGSPVVEGIDELIAATGEGDFDAIAAQADAHWADRHNREDVEAAIALWETAIHAQTAPEVDRREAMVPIFVNLSKAFYWLAHGHLRWDEAADDDAMLNAYTTGMNYGAQAIALSNDAWRRAMLYETPIPEAVATLTPDDVPAVYWYASNLGRWGLVRGIATVLSRVNDIKALMDRVEAMDPDFFYGATNRYFGVYYSKLPFGNPDVEQAAARLNQCIEEYPEYLETRILLAEDWAMVTQERAVAEEQIRIVLEADISQWPALYAENRNAQMRAEHLRGELDEIFR